MSSVSIILKRFRQKGGGGWVISPPSPYQKTNPQTSKKPTKTRVKITFKSKYEIYHQQTCLDSEYQVSNA